MSNNLTEIKFIVKNITNQTRNEVDERTVKSNEIKKQKIRRQNHKHWSTLCWNSLVWKITRYLE